ncbi:CaiB/BaiF CoA transferase family protein [Actinopolymorpha alba]|uniref:CaiB/BaiF CoA transferase family protein n=1 Tax=Actinopolymorpha alba TaxID=533267 RepID=UPI00037DCEF9|nr:CaiB/BaiF CoA-transferase family protein [Actinopolymorpha alba]
MIVTFDLSPAGSARVGPVPDDGTVSGPLSGIRVVEIASLAPGPFAATMLSDLGAEVLRLDRTDAPSGAPPPDPLGRGRRSVAIDLKHPEGVKAALRLIDAADVLVEGFRPGVCERLGIGPQTCHARNPRLVYARITGWGQDGPLAHTAGHDIDYLAVSGALEPIGPADGPPVHPLNYVADFAGGGLLAVVGILAALHERTRSGRGQVVDTAMAEGAALLLAHLHGLRAAGMWSAPRGRNLLDGGAPFYRTYPCADGRYVAVGALEPKFYAALLAGLGLAGEELPEQYDQAGWPRLHERFAAAFRARTRDEWAATFADTDACVAPVLDPDEAPLHPQLAARGTFVDVAGMRQPGPAPRLSRTPGRVAGPAPATGQHTREALSDWGFEAAEIEHLLRVGAAR